MASDRVRLALAVPVDLVANSGEIVGRLLALEVELPVACGGEGGNSLPSGVAPEQIALRLDANASESSTDASLGTPATRARASNGITAQSVADRVQRVWAHYQRVIPGGQRYALDEKRKRLISTALGVMQRQADGFPDAAEYAVTRCCEAIDGLAASPHHNGQNDRGKKYLGIQYALAGRGTESVDERIDKMCALAKSTVRDYLATLPSAASEMVAEHMNKVAASLRSPQDENLRRRAEHSVEYLRKQHGLAGQIGDSGDVVWSRSATS